MALTLAEKIIQSHIVQEACSSTVFKKANQLKEGKILQ